MNVSIEITKTSKAMDKNNKQKTRETKEIRYKMRKMI